MQTYFYKAGKRFHILQGTRQATPPIIMLHGGAWISGNPRAMLPIARYLNDVGFTVVIPQYSLGVINTVHGAVNVLLLMVLLYMSLHLGWYGFIFGLLSTIVIHIHIRLSYQNGVIEPLMDIADLLKFLQYEKVILMGYSAGAHLASLYATLSKADNISGVVCLSGVYSDKYNMNTSVGQFLAHNIQFMRDPYPIYHVDGIKRRWLIVNCELDSGLKRDARDFAVALIESGHSVSVKYMETSNHLSCIRSHETFDIILSWLDAKFTQ